MKINNKIATVFAGLLPVGNIRSIQGGETGCYLFRADSPDGDVVVKIAGDLEDAAAEIEGNLIAYERIADLGNADLNPKIFSQGTIEELPFIVMDDLGDTVSQQVISGEVAYSDATVLVLQELEGVYSRSREVNPEVSCAWLKRMAGKLNKYVNLCVDSGSVDDRYRDVVDTFDITRLVTSNITFATGDFTPDNVFLKDGRIRMIDHKRILPSGYVRGVNTIDLMMWGCISKDAYEFVGSEDVYNDLVVPFAFDEAERLGSDTPEALIAFGAARQYSLSTYFGNLKGRDNAVVTACRLEERLEELKRYL